jgi:hypothetical protein
VPPADPEAVYPEYLAVQDPADRVAGHVVDWLTDRTAQGRIAARIEAVARSVVHPGSAARAAEAVLAAAGGNAAVGAAARRAA